MRVDKSGTPQRNLIVDGEFINPTVFTCKENSIFTQQPNSTVIVQNGSTLKLESGSTYIIKDGATLLIKENSFIETDSCSKIIIEGNGKLIFENNSNYCINEATILDFEKGQENILVEGFYGVCANSIILNQVVPENIQLLKQLRG